MSSMDGWGPGEALWTSAVATVVIQLLCWAVAATLRIDKITDFAGSMNFVIIAVASMLIGGHYDTRHWLVVGYVVVSRVELGLFLLVRVLKRGKDDRFDDVRDDPCKFLAFWVFQMVWVWGVSLAAVFAASVPDDSPLEGADWAGLVMFVVGFIVQIVSDAQKYSFRAEPKNRGKFCETGLWTWSRHPNYFGEILMWWGVFVGALPTVRASGLSWGLVTIISPLLTMLILMGGSGIPVAERDSVARYGKPPSRDAFLTYRSRTSPLIPIPPSVWSALPQCCKVVLFEFPIYLPDPPSDDTAAANPSAVATPLSDSEQPSYSQGGANAAV